MVVNYSNDLCGKLSLVVGGGLNILSLSGKYLNYEKDTK